MSEFRVILTNESGGDSSNLNEQATTTSSQQKINKLKEENKQDATKKEIATISLAVANAGLSLYTQISSMQASLDGNSAYSQRVADTSKIVGSILNIGGSFLTGTAMSGGNIAIGGATAIISAGMSIAGKVIDYKNIQGQNFLTRQSENIQTFRLGNANNIWRK